MGTFSDWRARISIIDMAASIGYRLNAKAGTRLLEMVLYENGNKVDEIVIYNKNISENQTFFSRKIGDKGNLVDFVYNRLSRFPHTSDGFKGVAEVFENFNEQNASTATLYQAHIQEDTYNFKLSDYEIRYDNNSTLKYLNRERKLSGSTMLAFLRIKAVCSVKYNGMSFANVGFPYREPGKEDIVNFELRNKGKGNTSFKGFCKGGNKATACWSANFCEPERVNNIYIGESAIDMMSLYELKKMEPYNNCAAFISTGGNPVTEQIKNLKKIYPNAKVNLCFDNDIQGQIFNVVASLSINGYNAKGFNNSSAGKVIFQYFGEKDTSLTEIQFEAENFSSEKALHEIGMLDKVIFPEEGKDWNDSLKIQKSREIELS